MRHANTTTDIDLVICIKFRIGKTSQQNKFGNIITNQCLTFKCGLSDLLKLGHGWVQHHRENNNANHYPWKNERVICTLYNTTGGKSSYAHTRGLLCFMTYFLWNTYLPLEPHFNKSLFCWQIFANNSEIFEVWELIINSIPFVIIDIISYSCSA